MIIIDFPNQDGQPQRLVFDRPDSIIVAETLAGVRPALRQVARASAAGAYVAGFVSYEAAPAFDRAFTTLPPGPLPLVWFGVFRGPVTPPPAPPTGEPPHDWQPDTSRERYDACIGAVRAAIARGDSYQSNYTIRLRAGAPAHPRAFYEQLRAAQNARYAAYLDTGRFQILSASPELFFDWRGDQIVTRPMKGTIRRGRYAAEDASQQQILAGSEKDHAENLMIVDLLRNDIGRIAVTGSVRVPALFSAEPYPTVWQLTSTVAATTRAGTTLEDVFAALFPCGSITGAPKIATMRLLAELETTPRQIYCGAIGVVRPGGHATFNVAIRTVLVDANQHQAEYGVGGGITWDSTPAGEYDEVLAKAAVLTTRWPAFDLLETMLWDGERYTLLDRHLARLRNSAAYFGRAVNEAQIADLLAAHAARYAATPHQMRLCVAADGSATIDGAPAPSAAEGMPRTVLAARPVASSDPFLFHKTTNRAVYEERRGDAPDAFDVLLWNERGELTEFTIGNLVVALDGDLLTPPVTAGLLDGTLRGALLAAGTIREQTLFPDDLRRASAVWLINSVRGWVSVYVQERV